MLTLPEEKMRIGLLSNQRYVHYQFSKDILSEIKNLKTDNWHGMIYIIKAYAVISIFIFLPYFIGWWLYPISVLMIGAHQRGISTILHDSAHGVLVKNRSVNFLLGTFPTAWPIFQRYFAYKKSHVQTHHPFLGRSDTDPDLEFFISEGVFSPMSDRKYLWKVIILPVLGSKTWAYLKYLVRNRYQMIMARIKGQAVIANNAQYGPVDWKNRFDRIGFFIFWIGLIIASLVFGFIWKLVLFWFIPYLTSFHILGWFIEMSEHCSCTIGQSVNVYMARNRRSRHIEKWLTGINNDHYHLDHHLNPSTPFWLLPKAHKIRIRDENYARHCQETGGLFQKGKDGALSIISYIRIQNGARLKQNGQTGAPLYMKKMF